MRFSDFSALEFGKPIGYGKYFIVLIIVTILYLFLPFLFLCTESSSTLNVYICSVVCFFILSIVYCKLLFNSIDEIKYYSIAFVIQIALGLAHFLIFIEPSYFAGYGTIPDGFHHEYQDIFDQTVNLAAYKNENTILSSDPLIFYSTHRSIWNIITIPLCFLTVRWLNMAPMNVFFSLLASMNIYYIAKHYDGINPQYLKVIRSFTAFFPLYLLNDIFWRDSVGIGLMAIGLLLFYTANNSFQRILSLIIACLLCSLQRTVYPILFVTSLFILLLYKIKRKYRLPFLLITSVIAFFFINKFSDSDSQEYANSYVNMMSFLALPFKIAIGIIGPFPWIQFGSSFDTLYQLSDYILGILHLGILLSLLFNIKKVVNSNFTLMTIFGLLLILSGTLTTYMHSTYIGIGVIFILPWYFDTIGRNYRNYFLASFTILVLLNIAVVYILGHLGLASIWR